MSSDDGTAEVERARHVDVRSFSCDVKVASIACSFLNRGAELAVSHAFCTSSTHASAHTGT